MNFKALLKKWLTGKAAPWLAYTAVRLWFSTVRVKILNPSVYLDYFLKSADGRNVVAGSWHRHAIFFFYFFRTLGPRGIMISKSVDGEFTAKIAGRIRGPSAVDRIYESEGRGPILRNGCRRSRWTGQGYENRYAGGRQGERILVHSHGLLRKQRYYVSQGLGPDHHSQTFQ